MPSRERPVLCLSASCACGAVKLDFSGAVLSMMLCSCLACQKATGSGHATIAMVRAGDVSVSGHLASFSRPADSGATMTQSFCPVCGTPVHARSSRAAGVLLLPVGLFGRDTDWFRPGQLIFAATQHEWDAIPPEVPRHAAYRDSA